MGASGKVFVGTGALIAALALSGCATPGTGGGIDPVGTWGDPTAQNAAYLSLASDGSLSGSDGCNRLVGSWELDEADEIEFHDVASTLMACEGVETPLAGLDTARISGTTMTVFADDEAQIATLERTSESPETASPEPSPTDLVVPVGSEPVGTWGTDDPQQPHLVLGADGSLAGSDGCNALVGTWELDDDGTIEFEGVATTLMECPDVDQALGRLDSGVVEGDTLTVRDDHDVVLATLPRTA